VQVFKFGGASVKDADGIRRVIEIVRSQATEPVAIVVSAMGKTTNHLERLVLAWRKRSADQSALFKELRKSHGDVAAELLPEKHAVFARLEAVFSDMEQTMTSLDPERYDMAYDQVVSQGEMLSTLVVSAAMNEAGVANTWIDARTIIQTDSTYREGRIEWEDTERAVARLVKPAMAGGHVLTQGFIGRDSAGLTTTLGREGSDFTAAILGYCLGAESVTIWKDVPGVLNADPRYFKEAVKIDRLSYRDAIEMTYYGAQVIHPRTIQPLQQKKIPLLVKPFMDPSEEGTIVRDQQDLSMLPPVIVLKPNQVLLHISTKDFSFIAEENLGHIYGSLGRHRIRANMSLNSAISFSACFDHDPVKLEGLLADLSGEYNVAQSDNLRLITIIHYNEGVLDQVRNGHDVVMEEKAKGTAQVLLRDKART
jgi:aspartate kinase